MTEQDRQERLAHLLACGAPELEAAVVAGGAGETASTRAVRDFVAGPLTFCLLLGGTGTGKTVAASEALLRARVGWTEDGAPRWSYSPREARFIHASDAGRLGLFDVESVRTMNKLESVRWLVLDDLGAEFVTDVWRTNLGSLITERNSGKRKTLITSNLTVEAFRERYDARILSRIKGSGVVVGSGTEDLRQKRGAA
jgi:DNA replication protein DnaC